MKVLMLAADRFPPFRVDVKVLFGEELAKKGIQVDWILQSATPQRGVHRVSYGGGEALVGPSPNPTHRINKAIRIAKAVWHDCRVLQLARARDYEIVQVKDKFIGALPALLAARRRETKFAYWLSYPIPEAQRYTAIERVARFPWVNRLRGILFHLLLYKIILPRADIAFVQSQQMKEDIIEKGISGEKLIPIPMGVSTSILNRESSPDQTRDPSIAYLGNMAKERRIDFLLRCFARVLEKRPEAKLYLIGGTDEDTRELKSLAKKLHISSSVLFTGNLTHEQALDTTARCWVCVSPFFPTPILNSTSPTKLIEYLALGRPVVANHHPEQTRVLNESKGGICVDYDEVEFANAIVEILDSPSMANEMGRRGRIFAESRAYPLIAERVANRYFQLIAEQ